MCNAPIVHGLGPSGGFPDGPAGSGSKGVTLGWGTRGAASCPMKPHDLEGLGKGCARVVGFRTALSIVGAKVLPSGGTQRGHAGWLGDLSGMRANELRPPWSKVLVGIGMECSNR